MKRSIDISDICLGSQYTGMSYGIAKLNTFFRFFFFSVRSGDSVTFELSQGMVALLGVSFCITKPQLFNWQMCLFSEQTTILTPRHCVILVTITTTTPFCTRAVYPACALITIRCCSAPVIHIHRIT